MSNFENKTVVITGGNSGIGLATAQKFKAAGARVITNARNEARKAETLEQFPDLFDAVLVADVSNLDHLDSFFAAIKEQFGSIDVLYLNAGVAYFEPIDTHSLETYNKHFDINVKGVFFGVQKALGLLKEGSSILVTTSVVNQMAMPGSSSYAATKAAVRSLVQTIGAELAPKGIRINAISPGPIETPIFGKMGMPEEAVEGMAGEILSGVPAGRFGKADEVADAALFLAGNGFVNGTEIVVDGGMAYLS